MEIHDLIFDLPRNIKVSRVWNSPEFRLEWCPTGLNVCRAKEGAKLRVAGDKEISLKPNIIPWNELIQEGITRTGFFPIEDEGRVICRCRFFYCTTTDWLYRNCIVDSTNTSPAIMKQAVLILDDMYFAAIGRGSSTQRLDEVMKLAKRAEELCPEDVDNELRSQVLELWKQRVRNAAVDAVLDSNVRENDTVNALAQLNC